MLCVKRVPAQFDLPAKQILAPQQHLEFVSGAATTIEVESFIKWLSAALRIEQKQAKQHYEDFIINWNAQLQKGEAVNWKGIGAWLKEVGGNLSFVADKEITNSGVPVPAEKIIRVNNDHTVRVGEDQRSAVEMTALLRTKKKSLFSYDLWIGSIALVSLLIFWGWYLWSYPLKPSTLGNPRKVFISVSSKN